MKTPFLRYLFILLVIHYSIPTFAQKKVLGAEKEGLCSFYADRFDGLATSNGEKYDKNEFTAAHKTLPFNTLLAVINLKTNNYVIVRVNDRGPHKISRLIDISMAAAKQLGIKNAGIAKVRVKVVGFNNFQNLAVDDPLGNEAEIRNEEN